MIGKVRLPPRPQLQHFKRPILFQLAQQVHAQLQHFKRPILFQLAQQVHAQTSCVAIIPSIWAALDYFICTIKLIQPKRFNSECLFKRCGEKQSLPESQFNFFSSTCFVLFWGGGRNLQHPRPSGPGFEPRSKLNSTSKVFSRPTSPPPVVYFLSFQTTLREKNFSFKTGLKPRIIKVKASALTT